MIELVLALELEHPVISGTVSVPLPLSLLLRANLVNTRDRDQL